MRKPSSAAVLLLLAAALALPAFAQESSAPRATPPEAMPTDPTAIMLLVANSNGLNAADLQPWHMKVSFQLFDEQGTTLEEGHIEEFWAAPRKVRFTYTATDYSQTTYITANGTLRSGDKNMPPPPVLEMRNQFVEPLPDPVLLQHQSFDIRPQQVGLAKLDCLGLNPAKSSSAPAALYGRMYCIDADHPLLRIGVMGQAPDRVDQYLHNKVIRFQGRYVPQDIRMVRAGKGVITAHLDTIELLPVVNEADFTPPADATPLPRKIAISSGVAQGNLLKQTRPVYPQDAKADRVSGTVVLQVTIGLDGHLSDLKVISGPPQLRQAALDAASKWVYKPYLLNGQPVSVDTTINIVFNLVP